VNGNAQHMEKILARLAGKSSIQAIFSTSA